MREAPSCLSSRASSATKPERTLRGVGCASRLVRSIIPDPPQGALCTSRGLVYPIFGRPLEAILAGDTVAPRGADRAHLGSSGRPRGVAALVSIRRSSGRARERRRTRYRRAPALHVVEQASVSSQFRNLLAQLLAPVFAWDHDQV